MEEGEGMVVDFAVAVGDGAAEVAPVLLAAP